MSPWVAFVTMQKKRRIHVAGGQRHQCLRGTHELARYLLQPNFAMS